MLTSKLNDIHIKIKDSLSRRSNSLSIVKKLQDDINLCNDKVDKLTKVLYVYDYYLQNSNDEVEIFADTITAALNDVFNNQYKFKFDIKKRGSKLSCNFMLITDKHNYELELSFSQGNGVKEIIGVIIRILLVKLKSKMKILILDEPLSGVEINRQSKVALFLKNIATEFNVQLIVISHSTQFCDCSDNNIYIGE